MQAVTVFVPCTPQSCWRVFTDASMLASWVPGLRRAEIIVKEHGLPAEIHFEFASSLVYTLVYTYDLENREIHWKPKLGARDGVIGFVRFVAFDEGTRMTYGLEQGDNRTDSERELGNLQRLVDAFVAWMRDER